MISKSHVVIKIQMDTYVCLETINYFYTLDIVKTGLKPHIPLKIPCLQAFKIFRFLRMNLYFVLGHIFIKLRTTGSIEGV